MTLSELITYCRLKGRVTGHQELGISFWQTVILSRGYEARITYTKNGHSMVENSVLDCKDDMLNINVSLEDLVKYLLGPKA